MASGVGILSLHTRSAEVARGSSCDLVCINRKVRKTQEGIEETRIQTGVSCSMEDSVGIATDGG